MNQAFSNIIPVLNVFLAEKVTVTKELSSKAYHISSYYLSKTLAELPYDLLNPLIFCCIAYGIANFDRTLEKFIIFLAFIIVECLCATFMGYGIAALAPDFEIG